jgi:phenylalanyl-tRNA synthetase beta chain
MAIKEVGVERAKGASNRGIYRIDIPANRQRHRLLFLILRIDLLCLEGLASALNVYMARVSPPVFTLTTPKVEIHVKGDVILFYIS